MSKILLFSDLSHVQQERYTLASVAELPKTGWAGAEAKLGKGPAIF